MKNVLILGVASVQYDAIKTLNSMGYTTHAVAMAKDGPGADEAHYFKEINILDEEKIIDYINDNNIDVVYSVGSDMAMPVVNSISEKLGLPHFVSQETAKICNNKDLMRQTLGANFDGNLRFQIIEDTEEEVKLDYPFIMKPTDSQGQRGIVLVHDYEQFLEQFKDVKKYSRSGLVILEQYISGPELSVNGYMLNGKLVFLEESDRETWPEYTGLIHKHIVPSVELPHTNKAYLKSIIEKACNKLSIKNGPFYVQMKLENQMPYIIEITPRLDGCHMWKLLTYYTELNLLELTFEHLLENKVDKLKDYNAKNDNYVLEFICQAPNTEADYEEYQEDINKSIESFMYYNQGDVIRPVNNKYEKIGYMIYRGSN
ncbi:hypothetical protein T233_00626 [Vagococcus lutrae LBD1]|uniref:ATP-grasp domain-containing protein n=1 Tax=Vagococcus lutrae LBD1 TaxID=1408226 RepID=V6QCL4_9ENTE|nr:ATP-grasp domain-containing protein [Vagococcus lutrae]EST90323.1 hypothetical protein T233_00626 [Vagococcus lutrae LBD1]